MVMPLLQFSELFVGLIDYMTVSGSSFEPEDAADAPLLLTVERGKLLTCRRWQFHSIGCGLRIGTSLRADGAVGIMGGVNPLSREWG